MKKSDLKSKLSQVHEHVARKSQNQPKSKVPPAYTSLATTLGGELVSNFAGSFCLIRTVYPMSYTHGTCLLGDLLDRAQLPLSAFRPHDQPGAISTDSLLFFDTETTGLGGAGAVAFLIGFGSVTEAGFEVRQYVIPDYSDETAMLEHLQTEFQLDKTLVTYNGAAFDLPLVLDRMIINKVARKIEHAEHLDLLHPTRRLFRRRLADCSLSNIEQKILNFHRSDDIPGYLIPAVYFEWLSERRTDQLKDVLEHNRLDIVSLLFLVRLIAAIHDSGGSILEHADDLHSLSRVYGRRKQTDRVVDLYRRIDDLSIDAMADDALFYHSLAFKRHGDLSQAVDLWRRLENSRSREGYLANIELAKYFEHKMKSPGQALKCTKKAGALFEATVTQKRQLRKRLDRLQSQNLHQ